MTVTAGEARGLLEDLVGIPSVSGEEAECAERLAGFFEEHGREVGIDDVGNVRAPAAAEVLLTSHIDTVPGWIPVRVEDGVLWGRGSVDAKGPLAAMAVAAVETGASYAGVVGEEADSRGARHLVVSRDAPGVVVNGEPSGWDGITLGYRGHVRGTFEARTRSVHSSRPEPNAIEAVMAWWAGVDGVFAEDAGASVFEQVTAKPVRVSGGQAADGMAVEASCRVTFRVPPGLSVEEVRDRVEEVTGGGTVEWGRGVPPVMMTQRSEVARLFRVAIRAEGGQPRLLRKTGTSDMNIYADAWSCPMVTYGPGDSDLDHTPDERVSLAEYDRSITVLERVCTGLLNDEGSDP